MNGMYCLKVNDEEVLSNRSGGGNQGQVKSVRYCFMCFYSILLDKSFVILIRLKVI